MSAQTYNTADPISVEEDLNTKIGDLDQLGKDLDTAIERLDAAEEEWDRKYDEVEEDLKEEYHDLGRKSPPSEAAITSATRKAHRAAYIELRKAKRDLDRIEKRMQSARTLVSARQTQANGLREEMKAGVYAR